MPLFVPLKQKNRLADIYKTVSRCPGREHFYMLIIRVLRIIQAKAQAVFEHHNFRQIALKKSLHSTALPGGLGQRRGKFLIRSFGQLAGFRARFLCNKCANNYMLSNVVGALYALFTSVLMYYLVQEPLGTKSGASKIANKNKQICLIYFDYISLQRCKV